MYALQKLHSSDQGLYVCHGKKVKECEEDPGRADDLGLSLFQLRGSRG